MSDDIEIRNNKYSTFYVGEVPWHKTGQGLDNPPTTKEGIIAAGMNWPVTKTPLYMKQGDDFVKTDSGFATVRTNEDGTIDELGIVGKRYQPLQNETAFDFFDLFLQNGLATLETAGSLSGGRRVWILAKLKGDDIPIVAKADDTISKYVLLSNSHDGSSPIKVGFTPIRVVCANTLAAAHSSKISKLLRIRHSGDVETNLSLIQNALNTVNKKFETTVEGYRKLAKKQINKKDLENYMNIVFRRNEEDDEEDNVNQKRVDRVTELFETGMGNDLAGVEGTLWAAYNGVTQYLSYENGRNEDNRLNSLWFGEAFNTNEKALEVALQMVA